MQGRVLALAVAVAAGLCELASAGEPIAAKGSISLRAGPSSTSRRAYIQLRDGSIAAPFPDPQLGARLIVSGGAAPGQCHAEISLDASRWHPIRGDGTRYGYFFIDRLATSGLRRAVIRPGLISIQARGSNWPCAVGAEEQRLPLTVTLRLASTRYCAAFGDMILRNQQRRFRATSTPALSECPKADLTAATLNILHGVTGSGCQQSDACRLADRIDLLFDWVAFSGCPDVVTLQEVSDGAASLIRPHLASACPFPYEAVLLRRNGIDDEMLLTRYSPVQVEQEILFQNFRKVLFVRLDHPSGPLDVFTTHLASSLDRGPAPCEPGCPEECVAAGAETIRQCQAVQLGRFVTARHDVPGPAIVSGDFNEVADSFTYNQLTSLGWIDAYRETGGAECNPESGIGCTSGREDSDLSDLESPQSNVTERIDYIFIVPPRAGSVCDATIDGPCDDDGDGATTQIFAGDPNPFAPMCGSAPKAICWPSDHEGVQLDLNCD